VNDSLISDGGVYHGVVNRAIRPFFVEVLLNEIGALSIDRIHELFRFLLALAASQKPPDFIFSWGIEEYP
jgi:hypothetical protein